MSNHNPLSLAGMLMTPIRPSELDIARDRERELSRKRYSKMSKRNRARKKQVTS